MTKPALWILPLLVLLAGCSSARTCHETAASGEPLHSIYVIRRAWHTGIIISAADWPKPSFLTSDFPKADYLEFGWGEAKFYQAEEETVWLALRAGLWPNSSVIHVIGLTAPLGDNERADEIVEVRISHAGLLNLVAGLKAEFAAHTPVGRELQAAPKPNRFYAARGKFHFPRMCNWWMAKRLQDAGCPVSAWPVVTASQVQRRAKSLTAGETYR